MLNLWDRLSFESRRPLVITHRGGVVSPTTPENTLGALRLAARRGYDIVEVDYREARDQVPMLYHGFAGSDNHQVDCDLDQ